MDELTAQLRHGSDTPAAIRTRTVVFSRRGSRQRVERVQAIRMPASLTFHHDLQPAMAGRNASDSQGPWKYTDPDGNDYLLQVVPMERDSTLAESRQPKAVVFQTADGWIRVTPVGHDFSPADLSEAELATLLRVAAGLARGDASQ